ncbi:Fatty-acid-binding protein 3, chloroplastic [Linum grandiflorum]
MLSSITTPISSKPWNSASRAHFRGKSSDPVDPLRRIAISSPLLSAAFPRQMKTPTPRAAHFSLKASSPFSSVGTAEYLEEPATNVKFPTSLTMPGHSSSLSLLGTGYREKTFAIIGVKVYAAGLYVDQSIFSALAAWKDESSAEIEANSSLFGSIFQAPSEKSLRIVLVRDVDGKTFWDALDGAISPRIKAPSEADKPALAKFRATFENGTVKKGAVILLTWLDPCKMHVCVDGMSSDTSSGTCSSADATIESANVTAALFDVFFGDSPVSPSLKMSVATGLAAVLK